MTFEEYCMGELDGPKPKRRGALISMLAAEFYEALADAPRDVLAKKLARDLAATAVAALEREEALALPHRSQR